LKLCKNLWSSGELITSKTEHQAAQKKIHALLAEVYETLPFPIVQVPVLPTEERVDYILKNLN
jgi:predicted ATPase